MCLDDLGEEEKRNRMKQQRLFIWAVMPSMAALSVAFLVEVDSLGGVGGKRDEKLCP